MKKLLFFTLFHPVRQPGDYDLTAACATDYHVDVISNGRAFPDGAARPFAVYREYLRQMVLALQKRNSYDGIVFLEPQIGVGTAFVARLLRLPLPRIVLINFIPREQDRLRFMVDPFYAFGLERVSALSVSSRGLIDEYRQRYRLGAKQFFIPDVIHYDRADPGAEEDYIFAGGSSHRDWDVLQEAARALPGLKFVVAASSRDRGKFSSGQPPNLTVAYDLPTARFYEMLAKARVVIVPLRRQDVAAGHLVILHAFCYGKAVIATRTVGTTEYIEDGVNGILYAPGDARELAAKIQEVLRSSATRERLSANALAASAQYSRENFVRNAKAMIDTVVFEAA
jgi:glycosyltransferase involved in cell wall biosynthesis